MGRYLQGPNQPIAWREGLSADGGMIVLPVVVVRLASGSAEHIYTTFDSAPGQAAAPVASNSSGRATLARYQLSQRPNISQERRVD
jgi:hypothetical protein